MPGNNPAGGCRNNPTEHDPEGQQIANDAARMRQFANRIDERPLIPASEPQKSFSQQETFNEDVTDDEYVEAVLRRMADRLFATVREEGRSVRTLTVKVRYNDRDENQRAKVCASQRTWKRTFIGE